MKRVLRRRAPARNSDERRQFLGAGIGVGIIVIAIVFAFFRPSLSGGEATVRAVFTDANQLKPGSVLRVGGLDIGKVTATEATDDGRAIVTMRLDADAPRLHVDARFDIKPRLAFEGNFFVQVDPGTPGARILAPGDLVPERRTSAPVQLDEVLDVFDASVRAAFRSAVAEIGAGLGGDTGKTGASSLRRANRALARALPATGRVTAALGGQRTGDLSRAVRSTSELAKVMAHDPRAMSDLITNYRGLLGALADNDAALSASLRGAEGVVRVAPGTLRSLDAMLPRLRTLAERLRPVLHALPAAARSTTETFVEIQQLSSARELPGLVTSLTEPVRGLPTALKQLEFGLPIATSITRCLERQILPTLDDEVPDGELVVHEPLWLNALHSAANLAGASPGFDANGTTLRVGLGQGDQLVQHILPNGEQQLGVLSGGLAGVRPKYPGPAYLPPKRPDVPCETQQRVNLEAEVGIADRDWRPVTGTKQLSAKERRAQMADAISAARVSPEPLASRAPSKDSMSDRERSGRQAAAGARR